MHGIAAEDPPDRRIPSINMDGVVVGASPVGIVGLDAPQDQAAASRQWHGIEAADAPTKPLVPKNGGLSLALVVCSYLMRAARAAPVLALLSPLSTTTRVPRLTRL